MIFALTRITKNNNIKQNALLTLLRVPFATAVLCFCFGVLASVGASATNIESVRVWRAPDHTRLVFDVSAPVDHTLFTLSAPNRLVIDIPKAEMRASLVDLEFSNTPVDRIRHGKRGSGVRVVLDLTSKIKPRSFVLHKHGDKRDRLVIDLYESETATHKTVEAVTESTHKKRDIVVAIDAGHGGEDPGALGPKRVMEKNIVFKISRELETLVNKEPGYVAQMVRTGDYYIPLKTRRNKAREVRADLFISIHADAYHNHRAKGASVFALSRSGATSETARFLASKENEADLIGGVGGVSLDDKDDVLAGVLVDLSMTATLANSLNVGSRVLSNIGAVTKLHKHQVEQAGFAVLKSPDVPSILVETGFISNPEEARKLNTSRHRKDLAHAIFKGVTSYFNDTPPGDTYIAWQKFGGNAGAKPLTYTIARGDTLSGIASRYKISVASLIKANGLSNTQIRVGQTIKIPTS